MHIRREYIHGPGIDNPIAMITFYDDELVGLYFYHTDALGSVIALTSVNGVVAEKYRYSPFGRTTIYDGSGSEIARSAIGNPYMFTARRMDEESGLYYYRARMYKPEIGRFLQTDPMGYIDTINPYAYCANNPLNWNDPWGLKRYKYHWYNIPLWPLVFANNRGEDLADNMEAWYYLLMEEEEAEHERDSTGTILFGEDDFPTGRTDADAIQTIKECVPVIIKTSPGTSITGPAPTSVLDVVSGVVSDGIVGTGNNSADNERQDK